MVIGRPELVELLLDRGAAPDAKDPEGNAPLHKMVYQPQVVERLLNRGADPDARDSNGRTALWIALGNRRALGSPETVELLLDWGADPHVEVATGRTPCRKAKDQNPRTPASQRLLELSCSP